MATFKPNTDSLNTSREFFQVQKLMDESSNNFSTNFFANGSSQASCFSIKPNYFTIMMSSPYSAHRTKYYNYDFVKMINSKTGDNFVHKELELNFWFYDGLEREYRYSFQGQEHDDEIKGKGNSVNYTYRMHDPRLGRFFAVDPLTKKYPFYSPYSFSGNRVIDMVELEGLEPSKYQERGTENVHTMEEYSGESWNGSWQGNGGPVVEKTFDFVGFVDEPIKSNENEKTLLPEINSSITNGVTLETTMVDQAAALTAKEMGKNAPKFLLAISKFANGAGGIVGGIDNGIQLYNDIQKENYGRAGVNSVQTAAYATGTALLFTPAFSSGFTILTITTATDLIQFGIEYFSEIENY